MSSSTTPEISGLSAKQLQELIEKAEQQMKLKRLSELTSLTDAYIHKFTAAGFTFKEAMAELKTFAAARSPAAPEKDKRGMKAKYRGPAGELWSGQGQQPKWMRALIESGAAKSKDEFLIKG